MNAGQEIIIFTRTYDFMVWVLQVTRHFPRMHRYDFTKLLLDATFYFRERMEDVNLRCASTRCQCLHI